MNGWISIAFYIDNTTSNSHFTNLERSTQDIFSNKLLCSVLKHVVNLYIFMFFFKDVLFIVQLD